MYAGHLRNFQEEKTCIKGTSSSISGLSFKGKTLIYPSGVGRTEGVKSQNSSAGSGDQVQLENDKNMKCKVDVKHN